MFELWVKNYATPTKLVCLESGSRLQMIRRAEWEFSVARHEEGVIDFDLHLIESGSYVERPALGPDNQLPCPY